MRLSEKLSIIQSVEPQENTTKTRWLFPPAFLRSQEIWAVLESRGGGYHGGQSLKTENPH